MFKSDLPAHLHRVVSYVSACFVHEEVKIQECLTLLRSESLILPSAKYEYSTLDTDINVPVRF